MHKLVATVSRSWRKSAPLKRIFNIGTIRKKFRFEASKFSSMRRQSSPFVVKNRGTTKSGGKSLALMGRAFSFSVASMLRFLIDTPAHRRDGAPPGGGGDVLKIQKYDETTEEEKRRKIRAKKISLVIFDKDGTLIRFDSMWIPWVRKLASIIQNESKLNGVDEDIFKVLGYCREENQVKPGLLASGTTAQIKVALLGYLKSRGLQDAEAIKTISNAFRNCDAHIVGQLVAADDLKTIFETLKVSGIKIAVCTSDDRLATEDSLRQLGVSSYVDMLVCGDDRENVPKPSPQNALRICKTLYISPEETMIVGDTIVDLEMGKSAQLGCTIGVLSGVGRREDLAEMSDLLIPKVGDLLPLVLKKDRTIEKEQSKVKNVLETAI